MLRLQTAPHASEGLENRALARQMVIAKLGLREISKAAQTGNWPARLGVVELRDRRTN